MTAVTITDTRWTPGDTVKAYARRLHSNDPPAATPVLDSDVVSADRHITYEALADNTTYEAVDPQGHVTRFTVGAPSDTDQQTQIDNLTSDVATLQADVTSLQTDVADLESRVSDLEAAAP